MDTLFGLAVFFTGAMLMVYGFVKAAVGSDQCSRCRDPMPNGYWCYLPEEGPVCRACAKLANLPHEWDRPGQPPIT